MKTRNPAVLLTEFVEAVGQASGAAGQLTHHFRNPGWMVIRDNLDRIKDNCVGLAVKGTMGGPNAKIRQ